MTSHLDYLRARDQQAELICRAERARQAREGLPVGRASRRRRLLSALWRGRSQKDQLPLPPGGVERGPIAACGLELE
jgi:hypothetical protein